MDLFPNEPVKAATFVALIKGKSLSFKELNAYLRNFASCDNTIDMAISHYDDWIGKRDDIIWLFY